MNAMVPQIDRSRIYINGDFLGGVGNIHVYYHDAGRSRYRENRRFYRGDCATRACALVTGEDYDDVWYTFDDMEREFRKSLPVKRKRKHKNPDRGVQEGFIRNFLAKHGFSFYEFTKSDHYDILAAKMVDKNQDPNNQLPKTGKRTRGRKISLDFLPKSDIVLLMAKHVLAVKNHKFFDSGLQIFTDKGAKLMKGYFFKPTYLGNDYIEVVDEEEVDEIDEVTENSETEEVDEVEEIVDDSEEETEESDDSDDSEEETDSSEEVEEPTEEAPKRSRSKVTPDDVRAIREKRAAGSTFASLAKEYGMSNQGIRNIVFRVTWKHID